MDNRPIGVFDSGIGGLTVTKELISKMPRESIVYFGDTGRVPYGTRSSDTIKKYAVSDINFLKDFNIKAIVIACGTASSVALEHVREKFSGLPIIGVVEPTAKAAALQTKNKKIGILGTSGTINSGAYQKALSQSDSEIEVVTNPCPLFVPIVENGYADSEIARLAAEEYLKPMIRAGVDTIILGCTHYPLLKGVISDIMGEGVALISSGIPTALYTWEVLSKNGSLSEQSDPKYSYYVSDSAESFAQMAEMYLQKKIQNKVGKVDIEAY